MLIISNFLSKQRKCLCHACSISKRASPFPFTTHDAVTRSPIFFSLIYTNSNTHRLARKCTADNGIAGYRCYIVNTGKSRLPAPILKAASPVIYYDKIIYRLKLSQPNVSIALPNTKQDTLIVRQLRKFLDA